MKRIPKIICLLLLLCACATACFIGCQSQYETNKGNVFDTELFHCVAYENETVTILSLTEEGERQTDYLVVPGTINGRKVNALGGTIKGSSGFLPANREQYIFYPKAKKVFFEGDDYFLECCRFDAETVIMSQFPESDYVKKLGEGGYAICSTRNADFEKYVEPDIVYYYNYKDKNDVYRLDCRGEEGRFFFPEAPIREGYIFGDWYYDEQCVNKWDGEYKIPPEEKELHVYANWVKE